MLKIGLGQRLVVALGLAVLSAAPEAGAAQPHARSLRLSADAVVADYARPGAPGCAAGVIRDGQMVYQRAFGLASLELGVPVTPQSVFYLGSISKQFTAASIVLASRQGLLSLDDDVAKWVPEIRGYGAPISLRHLLHHTSGLPDYYDLLYLAGLDETDHHPNAELLDLVTRQTRLDFQPGARFEYSNTNYLLLAEVLRRASGQSLPDYARTHIFAPLGMTHTRFADDAGVVTPGRVPAYLATPGGYRVGWSTNFDAVGAGGVFSTLEDLRLWDQTFYGAPLAKGLVEEMQTPGRLNDGSPVDYGLGLFLHDWRGLPVVEHTGALFGYRNLFMRIPSRRLSVIVLCNSSDAPMIALGHRLAELYLASPPPGPEVEPPKPAPVSPSPAQGTAAPLDDFIGTYRSRDLDAIYTVGRDGGGLKLRRGWSPQEALEPMGGDGFSAGVLTITFQRGPNGKVLGLKAAMGASQAYGFKRDRPQVANGEGDGGDGAE